MPTNERSSAYNEYVMMLASGEFRKNVYLHDFVEILVIDNDTIEVSYDGGASFVPLRLGLELRPVGGIRANVILHNTGGLSSNFTMATGTADFRDNRLVIGSGAGLAANVQGVIAEGAAAAGVKPVRVAGVNPAGNLISLQLDNNGNLRVVGPVNAGNPAVGGLVRMGGVDPSGNIQDVPIDTSGNLKVAIEDSTEYSFYVGTLESVSFNTGKTHLSGYCLFNKGMTDAFVKFYDGTASASSTPKFIEKVRAGESIRMSFSSLPRFAAGLAFRVCTGADDADATSLGADDIRVTVFGN